MSRGFYPLHRLLGIDMRSSNRAIRKTYAENWQRIRAENLQPALILVPRDTMAQQPIAGAYPIIPLNNSPIGWHK